MKKLKSSDSGDALLKEEKDDESDEEKEVVADTAPWDRIAANNYFKQTDLLAKYDFNIVED